MCWLEQDVVVNSIAHWIIQTGLEQTSHLIFDFEFWYKMHIQPVYEFQSKHSMIIFLYVHIVNIIE